MFEILLTSIAVVFILIVLIYKYVNTNQHSSKKNSNSRSSVSNQYSFKITRSHPPLLSRSMRSTQRPQRPQRTQRTRKHVTSNESSNNELPPKVRRVLKELKKTSIADISESTLKIVEEGIDSLNAPKFKSNKVAQDIKNHRKEIDKFTTNARSFINDTRNGKTLSDEEREKRRENLKLLKRGVTSLLTAVAGDRGKAAVEIFDIGHEITTKHIIPRVRTQIRKSRERSAAKKAEKNSKESSTSENE